MLKTKSPRYTSMAAKQSDASNHLWEDFVRQVGSYARRVNVAYGGVPASQRSGKTGVQAATWYNKPQTARI
jgi:hypothetical protein